MRRTAFGAALSALCLWQSVVSYPTEQHHVPKRDDDNDHHKANAIRDAFQFAWNGYKKHAFPHDELHPVSNGYGDSRYGRVLGSLVLSEWLLTGIFCMKTEMAGEHQRSMPSLPRLSWTSRTSWMMPWTTSLRSTIPRLTAWSTCSRRLSAIWPA